MEDYEIETGMEKGEMTYAYMTLQELTPRTISRDDTSAEICRTFGTPSTGRDGLGDWV